MKQLVIIYSKEEDGSQTITIKSVDEQDERTTKVLNQSQMTEKDDVFITKLKALFVETYKE